jgi:lysophospholipase L1-like esterase
LERDLLQLAPDLVLLQYCLNDNHQFLHFLNSSGRWLMTPDVARTLSPGDRGRISRLVSSSYLWFEVQQRLLALKLTPRSRFDWEDRPDLRTAWMDATWPATADHLIAMHRQIEQSGGHFAVAAVPIEQQLRPELLALDRPYVLKPQVRLGAICAEAGIPYLDLFPAFAAHHGDPLFRDGLHLAAAGHAVTARSIEQFLLQHHLLPAG